MKCLQQLFSRCFEDALKVNLIICTSLMEVLPWEQAPVVLVGPNSARPGTCRVSENTLWSSPGQYKDCMVRGFQDCNGLQWIACFFARSIFESQPLETLEHECYSVKLAPWGQWQHENNFMRLTDFENKWTSYASYDMLQLPQVQYSPIHFTHILHKFIHIQSQTAQTFVNSSTPWRFGWTFLRTYRELLLKKQDSDM